LVSCADHQQHDPEVFLWNARRALEAVCHLLITVHTKSPSSASGSSKEHSLDAMIQRLRKENVFGPQQGTRFDMARQHTNLGVHIQHHDKDDYSAAVEDTAHVLPGLLEWLYEESIAKSHLGSIEDLPVQLIREGGRDGPSLKDAATGARNAELQMELTASALRRELDEKVSALRAREVHWWTWLRRVAVTSTLTFAAGLCLGGGGASWLHAGASSGNASHARGAAKASAAEGETESLSVMTASTASVQPEASAALEAPVAAPSPSELTAPNELSCPPGMMVVPPVAGMHLGQPVGGRNNWPEPSREPLEPTDVPAFCLDATPRYRTSVDPTAYDNASVRKCERFQAEKDKPLERTCLDRDEAERICQAAVEDGHLPTLIEWEAAVRATVNGLQPPEREWTGERFPPAVLHRVDPNWDRGDGMWVGQIPDKRKPKTADYALLLAWNQQPPDNRHPERGFRCAAPGR
jgi:hypothetical protein